MAPSDMICFALYSAAHAMQQAYRPLLETLGLTYPQYIVLRALWAADGPLTVSAIGRAVQLESSTLTPLLKRLEAAGLLTRRRDQADERQVLVALTEAGQAMQAQADHIPACIIRKSGLDLDDLERLQAEVTALAGRFRAAP